MAGQPALIRTAPRPRPPAGHDLCRQGDAANCLWLLQEGQLLALRHGRELELVQGPCLVGESVLLAEDVPAFGYRAIPLRAVSACRLWQWVALDPPP
jgi:CRP-like cAMP-binding protein